MKAIPGFGNSLFLYIRLTNSHSKGLYIQPARLIPYFRIHNKPIRVLLYIKLGAS